MIDLLEPTYSKKMRLVGYSDNGGRPDCNQVMIHRGHAYVGHVYSGGFSVVDVHDPSRPVPVSFIKAPPHTWTLHLQTHDDLLLLINARDMSELDVFADEKSYFSGGKSIEPNLKLAQNWTAGMSVWDLSDPKEPRQIGFMPVEGSGLHRIWYTGGRWAYASALLNGFSDYILITIDMNDPTKPQEAGRFWLPGMNTAAGERLESRPENLQFVALHHPIVHGDIAYCSWRDAGLVVVDVADKSKPKMIAHKSWAPPFGGGTHNALPLPDRDLLIVLDEAQLDHQADGEKLIWVFDIREPRNPISISTFQSPTDADYKKRGGHFGPHNIHENRPGSFISSDLIFATYQNAGVRVFDIQNKYAPVEIAALVPPAPSRMMGRPLERKPVIQTADVFVNRDGLIFATDHHAGLYIMELQA